MLHPLDSLRPESRVRLLVVSGLVTLVMGALLGYLGRGLTTATAPHGALSLQLAGSPLVAATIMKEWRSPDLALAENLVVADYGFLIAYSTFLGLACFLAARLWPTDAWIAHLGIMLAWGQWFAALFDAIENAALLNILQGALDQRLSSSTAVTTLPNAFVVGIGWYSSVAKWTLVEVGLLFIALAVFARVGTSWRTILASR